MALARIKTIEKLRFCAPGEQGKLLGLDRIPEARTLREKIALLTDGSQASQWSAELCAEWMAADSDGASMLYVDGHVRVCHGSQTKLPRHYVARQKLCLRATVDYRVNAMDGQPFFMVSQAVDPGMLKVLEHEIVPRLERDVPNQPSQQELETNPLLHIFILIFDREGCSPDFFVRMKARHIACITYHKYPGEEWPLDEFKTCTITLPSGEQAQMQLAERGTFLGGKIWVREIRKLTESGRQIPVISTDYLSKEEVIAVAMFARWSQENFFKYMRINFNLDRLIDYSTEQIPDTVKVVNPACRRLDGQVRSKVGILNRKRARFAALTLTDDIEPGKMEVFELEKADLHEEISTLQQEVETLKQQRKETPRHTVGNSWILRFWCHRRINGIRSSEVVSRLRQRF